MITFTTTTLWIVRGLLLVVAVLASLEAWPIITQTIRNAWLRLRSAIDSKNPDAPIFVTVASQKTPLDLIVGRTFPAESSTGFIPEGTEADLNFYYDYMTRLIEGSACLLALPGWFCTRDAEHDGPCAARPVPGMFAPTPTPQLQYVVYDEFTDPSPDPYSSFAREMTLRPATLEESERYRWEILQREGLVTSSFEDYFAMIGHPDLPRGDGGYTQPMTAFDRLKQIRAEEDHHRRERRVGMPAVLGAPYNLCQHFEESSGRSLVTLSGICLRCKQSPDIFPRPSLWDYALRDSQRVVGQIQDETIIEDSAIPDLSDPATQWSLTRADHVSTAEVLRALEARVRKIEQKLCRHAKGFADGLCPDCGLRRDEVGPSPRWT